MDNTALKLLGLQRAEYEKAKSDERLSFAFQISITTIGLVSIFSTGDVLVYGLTLASLLSTILKWRFSTTSKSHKSVSDRARRLVFLIEGLGFKISSKEITDVIASFSVSDIEGEKFEDSNYFDTKIKAGYKKLCVILQESSFFSRHLFEICAKQTWAYVIAAFVASFATLLILPQLANQNWSTNIARIVIVILMFLISSDLLGKAISYAKAASIASKADDRLEQVKKSKNPEHDTIFIFADYNAGVENAPLISTAVYERNRERLNKLWKKRNSNWK